MHTIFGEIKEMNIFVGSLSYDVTENELREEFEAHGIVNSVKIIVDRDTNRSKGFGFIEMDDKAEGEAAIESINGKSIMGREVAVNEARPREERPRRTFGGGDRGRSNSRRY